MAYRALNMTVLMEQSHTLQRQVNCGTIHTVIGMHGSQLHLFQIQLRHPLMRASAIARSATDHCPFMADLPCFPSVSWPVLPCFYISSQLQNSHPCAARLKTPQRLSLAALAAPRYHYRNTSASSVCAPSRASPLAHTCAAWSQPTQTRRDIITVTDAYPEV